MELKPGVFYTGVQNPGLRVFDIIMRTEYGTSYNSYVVKGSEKTALIECAHLSFYDYFLGNIREALQGGAADYLVLNHCEPDHTGSVARLLEDYPGLTIVTSQAGAIYIKAITNLPDLRLRVVKEGDKLELGEKTLEFIPAPFLHWPDSMFTWLPQDNILFSCDFLGTHFCEPQIFDNKLIYPDRFHKAMRYYYDCIFAPFKPYVLKGLDKLSGLDIEMACNSPGPILTKSGLLGQVMEKYREWSTPPKRAHKEIPIFYVSAYGNTALLAQSIARGILSAIPGANVAAYNIIEHDLGELTALMNESDAFLVGSPTINRDAVAPVWQLLGGIEAVNMAKRPVALFGSFGWSGEALPHLQERLASVKAQVFPEQMRVNFVPSKADLAAAEIFGRTFAQTL